MRAFLSNRWSGSLAKQWFSGQGAGAQESWRAPARPLLRSVRAGFDCNDEIKDHGFMPGFAQEAHEIIPRERGGRGIFERVVVEPCMLQHGRIKHQRHLMLMIVDERKGRDRAGAHAQHLPEKLGAAKGKPGAAEGL